MSPLLLHGNTNQYNINGLLCTYTEMFRIQTCCNYLSIFTAYFTVYRGGPTVLLLRKLYLYFTKDPEGVHYFPGGGGVSNFFQGGGGPNANFFRNPCTYLLFSGGGVGGSDPLSPSGSAHGQCHHNGTIFITVPLLTIIVRH